MRYDKLSKYHEILENKYGRDFIKTINNDTDWHGVHKLKYTPKPRPDFMKPNKPKHKIPVTEYLEALWQK